MWLLGPEAGAEVSKALARRDRSRGLSGLSVSPKLLLGLGVGGLLLALLFSKKKAITDAGASLVSKVTATIDTAVSSARASAFAAALPANLARYAPQMLAASAKYNVSPWVLAGIMKRESNGGDALTPPGPTGTGDFSKRTAGRTYPQTSGAAYVTGASGLPEDGKGWGRGLMQVDWGVHNAWARVSPWYDAQTNINKAAELFASNLSFFQSQPGTGVYVDCWRLTSGLASANVTAWRTKYPSMGLPTCSAGATRIGPYRDPRPLRGQALYEASLAAYNAGPTGVLQALSLGLPAEAATAGQDYVSWMLGRIGPWLAKF